MEVDPKVDAVEFEERSLQYKISVLEEKGKDISLRFLELDRREMELSAREADLLHRQEMVCSSLTVFLLLFPNS